MELREEHTERPQREVPPMREDKSAPKYRQLMDSKLKEWSAQTEKLRAKARIAEAGFKVKYDREIRNLEEKKAVLERRLEGLKKSGDQALGSFRSGIDKAMSDFKQALDNTISRFKKNS